MSSHSEPEIKITASTWTNSLMAEDQPIYLECKARRLYVKNGEFIVTEPGYNVWTRLVTIATKKESDAIQALTEGSNRHSSIFSALLDGDIEIRCRDRRLYYRYDQMQFVVAAAGYNYHSDELIIETDKLNEALEHLTGAFETKKETNNNGTI